MYMYQSSNPSTSQHKISPEFLIELAGLAVVGTLGSAVVVEGSDCKVVHVEPDSSPPVWGVVLCVPLMGNGGGRKG